MIELMPVCVSHNPNWVFFYRVLHNSWVKNVISNVANIALNEDDIDNENREELLLRASRTGWTFADNFTANWQEDDKAEKFVRRFIDSWIPYCRNSSGASTLQEYMSYLLGMEIRIVRLWSNTSSDWDRKAVPKMYSMENTRQLPNDYMINSDSEDPTTGAVEGYLFKSESNLNDTVPNWKTVVEDSVNGWYPTSHYDIYLDLESLPKSDVTETTAEEIIAGLFYELADVFMVLRAVVYSYKFEEIVKVSSGTTIEEIIL